MKNIHYYKNIKRIICKNNNKVLVNFIITGLLLLFAPINYVFIIALILSGISNIFIFAIGIGFLKFIDKNDINHENEKTGRLYKLSNFVARIEILSTLITVIGILYFIVGIFK